MLLEVMVLAMDVTQRPRVAPLGLAVVLADEDLDVVGEPEEAGVEVAGNPMRPALADAAGCPCGVLAGGAAVEDDLCSVRGCQ
jgi:hypothetical protein